MCRWCADLLLINPLDRRDRLLGIMPKVKGGGVEPSERQLELARGVLHKGKSFKRSAIDAGYSPKVGSLGVKYMRRDCPGVDMAFVQAAKEMPWQPEEVKAVIRARLLSDITAGKSTGLERACEVLGRDKTIDMFVRSGDVQIGIFANVADDPTDLLPPSSSD